MQNLDDKIKKNFLLNFTKTFLFFTSKFLIFFVNFFF